MNALNGNVPAYGMAIAMTADIGDKPIADKSSTAQSNSCTERINAINERTSQRNTWQVTPHPDQKLLLAITLSGRAKAKAKVIAATAYLTVTSNAMKMFWVLASGLSAAAANCCTICTPAPRGKRSPIEMPKYKYAATEEMAILSKTRARLDMGAVANNASAFESYDARKKFTSQCLVV